MHITCVFWPMIPSHHLIMLIRDLRQFGEFKKSVEGGLHIEKRGKNAELSRARGEDMLRQVFCSVTLYTRYPIVARRAWPVGL